MVKHTDDYLVENVTDALLISIKEDLINKLEDKAKTIQKQVSILDHNKKHSLVLKYHEAYSLYKLLDAVYEKQLFSDNLHIKKIKRLITELNNKLDIFAKEEEIAIIDEDLQDDVITEEIIEVNQEKKLVLEGYEENTTTNTDQIEIPILFDLTEAFSEEEVSNEVIQENNLIDLAPTLETTEEVSLSNKELFEEEINIKEQPITTNDETEQSIMPLESVTEEQPILVEAKVETELQSIALENTTEEHKSEEFPTQETIYTTEEDLFMPITPESQPKLDWERITTEDSAESENKKPAVEKVSFSNPKYNELFNIAKTGINVDADDLVNAPIIEDTGNAIHSDDTTSILVEEETLPTKDVMQIEIFDLETVEPDTSENKPKKEKKKEKKVSKIEQAGQISLF
ncbi:MAG: hypothetical protein ACRCVU_02175 [Flavobacterium sp.]